MNNAFALIYASQGNPQLRDLIELRSCAALPIAGRYRIIDIILSNLTNSGVRSVGIITQRNYNSLMDHVGSGKEWNLSKKNGGLTILPPYDLATGNELFRGFVDALLSKRDYISHQRQQYCLLLGSEQVYRQDYNTLIEKHMETGADVTVLYSDDPKLMKITGEDGNFFETDGDRITKLLSAPTGEKNCVASLNAVVMDKKMLKTLVEDACSRGEYIFSEGVLKTAVENYKVVGLKHEGYVGRVTSVQSYFEVNHDMLNPHILHEVFNQELPVYTKTMDAPPSKFMRGCEVEHSLFGSGCDIKGRVKDSVIFRGVSIDQTADVENCIIMQNARIESGAKLRNMIIDKNAVIGKDVRCISVPYDPKIIRKGTIVDKDL